MLVTSAHPITAIHLTEYARAMNHLISRFLKLQVLRFGSTASQISICAGVIIIELSVRLGFFAMSAVRSKTRLQQFYDQ
jgi:hypothetical protein